MLFSAKYIVLMKLTPISHLSNPQSALPTPFERTFSRKLNFAISGFSLLFLLALGSKLGNIKFPFLDWLIPGAGLLLVLSFLLKGTRSADQLTVLIGQIRSEVTPFGLGLVFLMGGGLFLRLYGLSNGLPYIIPADESVIVDAGAHILKQGDFNPRMYYYPSFYIYLQTLVYAFHFIWGAFTGLYHDLTRDWPDKTYDVTSAPGVYYWGRILTVLIGSSGIPLVYFVVKKIWRDRWAALIASGILAFSSLAIENSQFIAVDIPVATLIFLALWPAWLISRTGDRRWYLFFGLMAGLATGVKWTGVLILGTGLIAHLQFYLKNSGKRKLFNFNLFLLFALAGGVTFLTTPYIFGELRGYTNGFITNYQKYRFSNGTSSSETPWLENLLVLWNDSAVVTLLAGGGVLLGVFRHTLRDSLLLSFPLVYLLSINNFHLIYPRTMLPLTYFWAIFAALFGSWLFKSIGNFFLTKRDWNLNLKFKNGQIYASFFGPLAIVGLLMFAPIRNSLYGGWFNSQPFSYERVGIWLEQNAGPGPLKLAELRSQQWPSGYPNLLAVRGDPEKEGIQADAHPFLYYQERGISYLAINNDRAAPFVSLGKGNYFDIFSKGEILENIETRGVEKPGPPFTIFSTGVNSQTLKLQHPLKTKFSSNLVFLGFNLGKLKAENEIYLPPEGNITPDWPIFRAGEIAGLSLYWQPQENLKKDYVVFIHLQPAGSPGVNLVTRDTPPLQGAYPTSKWKPGEILTDTPNLALPANLPPGIYNLEMGFYAHGPEGSFEPLLLENGNNSLGLGKISVQK